jgi:hypothetical protein
MEAFRRVVTHERELVEFLQAKLAEESRLLQ